MQHGMQKKSMKRHFYKDFGGIKQRYIPINRKLDELRQKIVAFIMIFRVPFNE